MNQNTYKKKAKYFSYLQWTYSTCKRPTHCIHICLAIHGATGLLDVEPSGTDTLVEKLPTRLMTWERERPHLKLLYSKACCIRHVPSVSEVGKQCKQRSSAHQQSSGQLFSSSECGLMERLCCPTWWLAAHNHLCLTWCPRKKTPTTCYKHLTNQALWVVELSFHQYLYYRSYSPFDEVALFFYPKI